MAFEAVESGGATAALDIPTLSEIENDDLERVRKRLDQFQEYSGEVILKYKQDLESGVGRESFIHLQQIVNEIGNAMIRSRKVKKVEIEEQLLHLQGTLGHDFLEDFPDEMIAPPNPFISPLGLHEYGADVMNDTTLEEGDKERLLQAMIQEAEANGLEVGNQLDVNKEGYNMIGRQILSPEVQAVYKQRIDGADRVVILKKSEEEQEEEGESFLWRGIKWIGKGILGFAGRVLGRMALYAALGGAGAFLIHRYIPGAPAFLRGIMRAVAPKFTDDLINIGTTAGGWVMKAYNAVKGFFSSIF